MPTVPAQSPRESQPLHFYKSICRDTALTSTYIAGAIFAAIGAQPSRHSVDVNAVSTGLSAEILVKRVEALRKLTKPELSSCPC